MKSEHGVFEFANVIEAGGLGYFNSLLMMIADSLGHFVWIRIDELID